MTSTRKFRTYSVISSFIAVILALALASAAQAKIVVGQSIARVQLGDSEAQVEAVLGAATFQRPPDFEGNVEWEYDKAPLDGAMSFKGGALMGLWTDSKLQKTSEGVGPGSSLMSTKRAYPGAKCSTGPFGPKSLICVIKSRLEGRTVETAFLFYTRSLGAREVDMYFAD
jgi:hypothetical protein